MERELLFAWTEPLRHFEVAIPTTHKRVVFSSVQVSATRDLRIRITLPTHIGTVVLATNLLNDLPQRCRGSNRVPTRCCVCLSKKRMRAPMAASLSNTCFAVNPGEGALRDSPSSNSDVAPNMSESRARSVRALIVARVPGATLALACQQRSPLVQSVSPDSPQISGVRARPDATREAPSQD